MTFLRVPVFVLLGLITMVAIVYGDEPSPQLTTTMHGIGTAANNYVDGNTTDMDIYAHGHHHTGEEYSTAEMDMDAHGHNHTGEENSTDEMDVDAHGHHHIGEENSTDAMHMGTGGNHPVMHDPTTLSPSTPSGDHQQHGMSTQTLTDDTRYDQKTIMIATFSISGFLLLANLLFVYIIFAKVKIRRNSRSCSCATKRELPVELGFTSIGLSNTEPIFRNEHTTVTTGCQCSLGKLTISNMKSSNAKLVV